MRPSSCLLLALAACDPLPTRDVSLSSADEPGHAAITGLDAVWGTGSLALAERSGASEVDAEVTLTWRGPEPEATLDVGADGVVRLGNTCEDRKRRCASDFDVVAPAVALTADLGTGDVSVQGAFQPVDVRVGTGDVDVSIVPGVVRLDTGTGSLTGSHVEATSADLRVGTGDVDLSFDAAQDQVDVDVGTGDVELRFATAPVDLIVFTGTGDVTLVVPPGAYALDLNTGTGHVDASAVTDDPAAASSLRVSVGTGDVTVRTD